MPNSNTFPISIFNRVTENQTTECIDVTFGDFVDIMSSFSGEAFAGKAEAPLFASTRFKGGLRRKSNATESGMIVLDIDDGIKIEEVAGICQQLGVRSLIYTTASHRSEHHKFRVCIPLAEPVPYETHTACWHAINHAFTGQAADTSKVGCESMFYVPGKYPDAPAQFIYLGGETITAEEWIASVKLPSTLCAPSVAAQQTQQNNGVHRKNNNASLRSLSDADRNIYETKLISEAALNKYLGSSGGWHQARFGLMMSMAMRAQRMGVPVSSADIVHLFNQVDLMDGGHYQSSKYQREILNDAAKALAQAV